MILRTALALCLLTGPAVAQSVVIGDGSAETVNAAAQIYVAPAGVEVQSGGTLTIAGTSSTPTAKFLGPTAGVPITVLSGGTIDLSYGTIENVTTLTVNTGGILGSLFQVTFADLAGLNPGTTPWIDLSGLASSDRENVPFSFNRITFSDPQGTPTRKNIKTGSNTPRIRMLGNSTSHGNRWGEDHDDDSSDAVTWHTGAVTRTSPSGSFDTLEEALKDSSTDETSVLTVGLGANAFIFDRVDWDYCSQSDATGPTIKNACLASSFVKDGDGDTNPRGKLINCIVAAGRVEETYAYNCTFYRPGTGAIRLKSVSGNNLLIENGFTDDGGNSFGSTSLTTATDSFFSGASSYVFQLVSSGGNSAIDAGTDLTSSGVSGDFEGEARGNDFPGVGSSPHWDIGADEVHVPTITTTTHKTGDNTPRLRATGPEGAVIAFFRWNGSSWVFLGTATVVNGEAVFDDPDAQADGSYTYGAAFYYGPGSYGSIGTIGMPVITVDTTPPAAPTNLRIFCYATVIDLEWDASTSADTAGYQVWRKEGAGGTYALLTPSDKLVVGTKYRDSTVSGGTTYYYKVVAVDDAQPE